MTSNTVHPIQTPTGCDAVIVKVQRSTRAAPSEPFPLIALAVPLWSPSIDNLRSAISEGQIRSVDSSASIGLQKRSSEPPSSQSEQNRSNFTNNFPAKRFVPLRVPYHRQHASLGCVNSFPIQTPKYFTALVLRLNIDHSKVKWGMFQALCVPFQLQSIF